jgi:holin-like protein
MKIFKQLLIILSINFLGEFLSNFLSLPLPGSIVGMLILLILLFTQLLKPDDIAETADFLLNNMAFFFIPAGVGVLVSYTLLSGSYFESVASIVLSTVVVMLVTGGVTQFLVKKETKNGEANR